MNFRILLQTAVLSGVAFLSGCQTIQTAAVSRAPYQVTAYKPHNPSAVRVRVSLSKQQVYVMEGDRPLLVAATCVGLPEKPTPTGSFNVYSKIATKRSGSYGFWVRGSTVVPGTSGSSPGGGGWNYVGYPMNYWVEFSPAYGFHQGYVWPVPRTHGCLRLHKNVAAKFYALVNIGTPVNIAWSQPEDATIGKSVPRPMDYHDPDPPAAFMVSNAVFAPPAGPLLVTE